MVGNNAPSSLGEGFHKSNQLTQADQQYDLHKRR